MTTDKAALPPDWAEQVRELARQRDAVILAHNYQLPEIQEVAHHVGDSLGLSRVAADAEASTIVFCGVHFMAETAKILSYDKTVLIPDERAGCSLAETITADQLRAWKAEHPGAVVVSYVNTTAAVKAETDICCTSSNAVDVVASIPADTEVLFCPDQFLGAHVQRELGRENMHIWLGECHVHAGINGADLKARVAEEPDAELFIHPECGCATSALYLVGAGVVPETRTRISASGWAATCARTSDGLMPACTWHSPAQMCMFSRPVIRRTCAPRNWSGQNRISRSSGIDRTTSAALDEVQQMSVSAFTAAVVLT